jgi:hypothetical protein
MPITKGAKTRTFRIDPALLAILDSEAEEQGITSSSLLNQILKKYALVGRFDEEDEAVNLSHDAVKGMVDLLTEEQLVRLGEKSGTELSSAYFYMMDSRDVDSVISFINIQLGKYSGWYQLHSSVENRKYTLLLSHQIELKWSIWLRSTIETFLKSLLDVPVTSEVMENTVVLSFKL